MGRFMFGVVILAALSGVAGTARASLITYTEEGTATGSFNGTAFSDALITITATADTSSISNPSSDVFVNTAVTTVTVAGLTGTFTDVIQAYAVHILSIPDVAAGFRDVTLGGNDLLATISPAFSTYDLSTPIGPITGGASASTGFTYNTTAGGLFLASVSAVSSFQAQAVTPVPETSTLAVAGFGAAVGITYGLSRRRRDQRRHRQPPKPEAVA